MREAVSYTMEELIFSPNQKGMAPALLLVAVVGVLAFLAITSSAPFKQSLLTAIFPKDASHAASGPYLETFDGSPTTPSRWDPPGWDVIRSGNPSQAPFTNPVPDCNGAQSFNPMADNYEYGVYKCPNHLMLRMANLTYGFEMLTPPALVDFSGGEASVKWDMSTLSTNGRNWIEMHLVPVNDHILMAAERWGSNRAAREVAIMSKEGNCIGSKGGGESSVLIKTEIRRVLSGNYSGDGVGQVCLGDYIAPSASQYLTLELRITKTHLKFGIPSQNVWFIDTLIADLGWDQGVLQFGVSAYNSNSNSPCFEAGSCPFTVYHFDNLSISPSIPFTIIKGDKALINSGSTQLNLQSAAPANSVLKFTGSANQIEVSFNNGTSWTRVPIAAQPSGNPEGDEHPDDYLIAVPQGVSQIQFRGTNWWGGAWMAENISVYAFDQAPVIQSPAPSPLPSSGQASPSPSPKPGDIDSNNKVDIFDYNILLTNFGQTGSNIPGDFDNNGKVDIFDYNVLLSNFGK